jgi:hypothetical protein
VFAATIDAHKLLQDVLVLVPSVHSLI